MGNRLNPHRRLLKAQARVMIDVRLKQSAANGVEDAKLQQGRVRSSLDPLRSRATWYKPMVRPHSSVGDEPERAPRASAKVYRY